MKLLVLDCDSTLSGIEGIDELARMRGESVFAEVAALTNQAMNGEVPLGEVFGRRMALIRPSRSDCECVGEFYIANQVPQVKEVLKQALHLAWTPVIVSGGFLPCIRPFADMLGIRDVYAVDVAFDETGAYVGYDEQSPTSLSGGKYVVVSQLLQRDQPEKSVMVGDGVSDLEVKGLVDLCIGFGGVVERPAVVKHADAFVRSMSELLLFLKA